MEIDYIYMNQFFCGGYMYDSGIEMYPARNWHSTPPESGDGWVLLSIFDTEVEPCAEWKRCCWWTPLKLCGQQKSKWSIHRLNAPEICQRTNSVSDGADAVTPFGKFTVRIYIVI